MDNLIKIQEIINSYINTVASNDNIKLLCNQIYSQISDYKCMQGKNENIPLYKHDCIHCMYLGDYLCSNLVDNTKLELTYYDLYICDKNGVRSLVARYGDNPQDYESATWFDDNKKVSLQPQEICLINPFAEIIKRYKERF